MRRAAAGSAPASGSPGITAPIECNSTAAVPIASSPPTSSDSIEAFSAIASGASESSKPTSTLRISARGQYAKPSP